MARSHSASDWRSPTPPRNRKTASTSAAAETSWEYSVYRYHFCVYIYIYIYMYIYIYICDPAASRGGGSSRAGGSVAATCVFWLNAETCWYVVGSILGIISTPFCLIWARTRAHVLKRYLSLFDTRWLTGDQLLGRIARFVVFARSCLDGVF